MSFRFCVAFVVSFMLLALSHAAFALSFFPCVYLLFHRLTAEDTGHTAFLMLLLLSLFPFVRSRSISFFLLLSHRLTCTNA